MPGIWGAAHRLLPRIFPLIRLASGQPPSPARGEGLSVRLPRLLCSHASASVGAFPHNGEVNCGTRPPGRVISPQTSVHPSRVQSLLTVDTACALWSGPEGNPHWCDTVPPIESEFPVTSNLRQSHRRNTCVGLPPGNLRHTAVSSRGPLLACVYYTKSRDSPRISYVCQYLCH